MEERLFYTNRPLWLLLTITFFFAAVLYFTLPDAHSVATFAQTYQAFAMGVFLGVSLLAVFNSRRPIIAIRRNELIYRPLTTPWDHAIDLSGLSSVTDWANPIGRLRKTVRLAMRSGRVERIELLELAKKDRAEVRALLEAYVAT